MRTRFAKAFAILIITLSVFVLFSCATAGQAEENEAPQGAFSGKFVILHSNDVHGAVEGYAKMATLRKYYESEGAEVILVDAGDFARGTVYVNHSHGQSAVELMNKTGYTIVGLGNHEFDEGLEKLQENLSKAEFTVICADIFGSDGMSIYNPGCTFTTAAGKTIGFFALDTPQSLSKVKPSMIADLTIATGDTYYEIAQSLVGYYRDTEKCDLVICVAHLGIDPGAEPYTSYNLYDRVQGIDFIIDAHSHSVFTSYEGRPIQQTGTGFENIGVIIIDDATGVIENYFLTPTAEIEDDPEVVALAKSIMDEVDREYDIKFAESKVDLTGEKAPGNRTMETSHGDLIADALLWSITSDPKGIDVPVENLVAIENGGGIRDWIRKGDVTRAGITNVLPFANTVSVVYVKGSELLEALEASTFCTPQAVGGFPQIAGMEITVDITKEYAAGTETYPGSVYYGPAEIRRVTINSVNGKAFDPEALYGVVTNDFCADGGDTYYALKNAASSFDTGIQLEETVMAYITEVLGGVIGEQYAEPAGRITIIQ
ncbi:MAG: bifunctional metallophosphatase/5'-nucleotidase [Spirochaetales bacterium]|nr:bifunctional metallophosphatase/5'-nucleotidase [Spirochaetales bacterium]